MISKDKIAARFERDLKAAKSGLGKQYDNTKKCIEFYSGDIMNYEDQIQYTVRGGKKKRAMIRFNKVMPYVDAVSGFMQQNRRQIKFVARNVGNEKQEDYSTRANATFGFVRDNAQAEHTESEQTTDMLVNGYGAVETDMSYIAGNASSTPNGDILITRVDPQTLFWDFKAKRKNLSDARYVGYWQDYTIDDALSLFTNSKDGDFESADAMDTESYYYNPYGGRYDKVSLDNAVDWADKEQKLVRVYNYQWWEFESYYQADNPLYEVNDPQLVQLASIQMKQLADANPSDDMYRFDPMAKRLTFDSKIKGELVKFFGDRINPVEFKRKKYYTAVVSGKKVFTAFSSICQQDFSIQFKTGTYDASRKIFIGMVNNMMEPQLYYNKALTELMFTISANSKGGAIVERSAVKDVQNFEDKYASTTGIIVVEDGAVSGGKIMPKGQNIPTTGLDNIIMLTDQSIADASGVDKSFLGSKESAQETGILFKRRIRQVISTMAKYFDSDTLYQKKNARLSLDYMRVWSENNEGAEFEIQGNDGQYQSMTLDSDLFMAEYGIVLNESSLTQEDKQETAEILSSIGDKMVASGAMDKGQAIYMTALKYLPIDGADRQELSKIMQQQAPQIDPAEYQALQQQVQLLSSDTNKADVEKKLSDARLNDAKAAEIMGGNTAELEAKQLDRMQENEFRRVEQGLRVKELELEAEKIELDREKTRTNHKQVMIEAKTRMPAEMAMMDDDVHEGGNPLAKIVDKLTENAQQMNQALMMLAQAQQNSAEILAQAMVQSSTVSRKAVKDANGNWTSVVVQ